MTRFAEALVAIQQEQRSACLTCNLIEDLSDEEGDAVAEALDDPAMTAASISRALSRMGHKVSDGSVRRHRRGDCSR